MVNEKENVKLSCELLRFRSNKVYWSLNGISLQQSLHMTVVNSSINGTVYSTLNIMNISVRDSGTYKCFGEFNGIAIQDHIQLKVRGKLLEFFSKKITTICCSRIMAFTIFVVIFDKRMSEGIHCKSAAK